MFVNHAELVFANTIKNKKEYNDLYRQFEVAMKQVCINVKSEIEIGLKKDEPIKWKDMSKGAKVFSIIAIIFMVLLLIIIVTATCFDSNILIGK